MAAPSSATSFAVAVTGSGSEVTSPNESNGVVGSGPDGRSVGNILSRVPVSVAANGTVKLQSPHEIVAAPIAVPVSELSVIVTSKLS